MKLLLKFSLTIIGVFCIATGYCQNEKTDTLDRTRNITWRLSEQQSIALPSQILDGQFIPIGDKEPNAILIEDSKNRYKGHIVYKFSCTQQIKRLELSSAFGHAENLKGYTPGQIQDLSAIGESYINSFHGNYGNVVIYDWYTKFPEEPSSTKGGIIAQLHGRPDRTLLINPKGELIKLTISQLKAMLDTAYFDLHIGKSKSTKLPNGWRIDDAAGGPIAEMNYRPPYLYLMVRSSAERVSESITRTKPLPERVKVGEVIGKNGKTGFLAFSEPTSKVPVNEWIHFRMEVKYSKYSHIADEVLEKGYIKVWMDEKMIADIKDVNIGKNDELGPYFKYGIYVPGKDGFSVAHCGFTETIKK